MMNRHCDHCYQEGYKAGEAAAKESEPSSDGPERVWISLTDEIRQAYGIPADQDRALAIVQGDRILSILETYGAQGAPKE